MASLVYRSSIEDTLYQAINFETDTFKLMLTTAAYVPDRLTHTRRSHVTDEVVGVGYVAGGVEVDVTVQRDTVTDRVNVLFDPVSWANSSLAARGGVLYKSRGGAPAEDELVAYIDFGSTRTTQDGDFNVAFQSPYTFQV